MRVVVIILLLSTRSVELKNKKSLVNIRVDVNNYYDNTQLFRTKKLRIQRSTRLRRYKCIIFLFSFNAYRCTFFYFFFFLRPVNSRSILTFFFFFFLSCCYAARGSIGRRNSLVHGQSTH